MTCTLQIHRHEAPIETWETIGAPGRDCGPLAERARRMCILFQMRPQDGCDGVRVMRGDRELTRFDVCMHLRGGFGKEFAAKRAAG